MTKRSRDPIKHHDNEARFVGYSVSVFVFLSIWFLFPSLRQNLMNSNAPFRSKLSSQFDHHWNQEHFSESCLESTNWVTLLTLHCQVSMIITIEVGVAFSRIHISLVIGIKPWNIDSIYVWIKSSNYFPCFIRYRTVEATSWSELPAINKTVAVVDNLQPGERYVIQVRSVSHRVESFSPQELEQTVRKLERK